MKLELPGPERCCGCAACCAACPKDAIVMSSDDEGFLQPVVDAAKCVQCGRCRKVCPVLEPGESALKFAQVYAVRAKDRNLRLDSSSGGVFSLLARRVLSRGGLVFGAACELETGRVRHIAAENEQGLARLRGSKYVQSDVGTAYRQVREALSRGREVLFSGTPCQCAALRRVLGQDDDRLLCVDVICHAVPSPLAWQGYLETRAAVTDREGDGVRVEGVSLERVSFRSRDLGWKKYSLSLRFANGVEYGRDKHADSFLCGFLSELYSRRSCQRCAVREGRSGSDLTIADYWGVWNRFPEMDDDTGTSLVLVKTEKGTEAFAALVPDVEVRSSDVDDAVRTNPPLVRSSPCHPRRAQFFALLRGGADFDAIVQSLLRPPLLRRCRLAIKRLIRRAFGK